MNSSSINNSPLKKQLTHRNFCSAVQNIEDMNELKNRLCKMHLLYLRQQEVFVQVAKNRFS